MLVPRSVVVDDVGDFLNELQIGHQSKRCHFLVKGLCRNRLLFARPHREEGLDQVADPFFEVKEFYVLALRRRFVFGVPTSRLQVLGFGLVRLAILLGDPFLEHILRHELLR